MAKTRKIALPDLPPRRIDYGAWAVGLTGLIGVMLAAVGFYVTIMFIVDLIEG